MAWDPWLYFTSKGSHTQDFWKLVHLFIPSKTAILVPEFEVKDLPLGRSAALVPSFTVKDLPLGRTL